MALVGTHSLEGVEQVHLVVAEPLAALAAGQGKVRATPGLLPILTAILWVGCLAVGAVGFVLPYARPVAPPKPPEPVIAELLKVELTHDSLPASDIAPPKTELITPPPLSEPLTPLPDVPPLLAVAEPSAVAFALPVEGPARMVEPAQAAYVQPVEAPVEVPAPVPAVQTITYGQGEGRQPAPNYPRISVRQGQEGVVRVRFSVGENGRVLGAEAVGRCPWPLLNESALEAVRDKWRFPRGGARLYEVAIRFELTK